MLLASSRAGTITLMGGHASSLAGAVCKMGKAPRCPNARRMSQKTKPHQTRDAANNVTLNDPCSPYAGSPSGDRNFAGPHRKPALRRNVPDKPRILLRCSMDAHQTGQRVCRLSVRCLSRHGPDIDRTVKQLLCELRTLAMPYRASCLHLYCARINIPATGINRLEEPVCRSTRKH